MNLMGLNGFALLAEQTLEVALIIRGMPSVGIRVKDTDYVVQAQGGGEYTQMQLKDETKRRPVRRVSRPSNGRSRG